MLRGLAVATMAVAVVATALPLSAPAEPAARGLVAAHVHSAWLAPGSPVSQSALRGLLDRAGVQVVPFGVPLAGGARASAAVLTGEWLDRVAGLPSMPQMNTFALPPGEQGETGLRALFRELAPVLAKGRVALVVGANEPLTRGKGWPSADAAEARVRLEHRLWHEVSALPFCHKFTPPQVNVAGMDWTRMERLWADGQDAVCYDWYAGNSDPFATLDHLHATGQRFGKPVHVLETAVPGNDPATLARMAERADSVTIYELLARAGGEDERFGAWLLRDGKLEEAAPGAMLQAYQGSAVPRVTEAS